MWASTSIKCFNDVNQKFHGWIYNISTYYKYKQDSGEINRSELSESEIILCSPIDRLELNAKMIKVRQGC